MYSISCSVCKELFKSYIRTILIKFLHDLVRVRNTKSGRMLKGCLPKIFSTSLLQTSFKASFILQYAKTKETSQTDMDNKTRQNLATAFSHAFDFLSFAVASFPSYLCYEFCFLCLSKFCPPATLYSFSSAAL